MIIVVLRCEVLDKSIVLDRKQRRGLMYCTARLRDVTYDIFLGKERREDMKGRTMTSVGPVLYTIGHVPFVIPTGVKIILGSIGMMLMDVERYWGDVGMCQVMVTISKWYCQM